MKTVNQILSVFLAMIFIVSSTGIFIYKTYCSCTGTKQIGIYVKPESCDENFHLHHMHNTSGSENLTSENCCHECTNLNHDCGCDAPEVQFFRLSNDITQDIVSFERTPSVKITNIIFTAIVYFTKPLLIAEKHNICFELPPKIKSAKFLLIQINQLKIPVSA